jgi:hypothetical protein
MILRYVSALTVGHFRQLSLAFAGYISIYVLEISYTINIIILMINRLKRTGYMMHQQFNIQQLYAMPTLYLCVLYLSENKQRLVPLTA